MSNFNNIWVLSENEQDYAALLALAKKIGGDTAKATALWIGSAEAAERLRSFGPSAICLLEAGSQDIFVNCLASATQATLQDAPSAILCATSKNTRLFAALLAAQLKTRVVNDASALFYEGSELYAEHMVYGGSATRREHIKAAPAVVLVSDSLLIQEAAGAAAFGGSAELTTLPCTSTGSIELVSRKPRDVETVNLAGAQTVVSVGRGIENEEDLAMIRDLSQSLQGEVGCTRPIAEGAGWMSHERYIGVSGAMLKPNLFIAIGLSGQIQHMVGANRAKTIVAINSDKNAPIFKMADYGIVGNLYDIVPKLAQALK